MKHDKNIELYREATKFMPGGCSAGGRNNKIYGMPLYLERADGSKLYSVDGNEYIDYHCGAGAVLYGHNNPRIKKALEETIEDGFFMNYDSGYTLEFAKKFLEAIPAVEKIRLTNSGTESTMAAIRLARAYTRKPFVVKMDGHFHGMHEMIWFNHSNFSDLNEDGEALRTLPDSAGITNESAHLVKVIQYNDISALEKVIEKYKNQIAAVILEPISFNCGCYIGEKKYLHQVRELCTKNNMILIFDEVITGLRFRAKSAQAYYEIDADLSTFAKAIGGGVPLGLIGGKSRFMDMFNPVGPVVCSGTTSGTQMAIRAGIECLNMVTEPGFYNHIERIGTVLYDGLNDLFKKHSIPGHVRGVGARFALYFGIEDPTDDLDLRKTMKKYDIEMNDKFVQGCLQNGLYFHHYGKAPYPAHCGFGVQHTLKDITLTLEKIDSVFKKLG